ALLGVAACLQEDYPRGKLLCEEGQRMGQTTSMLYPANWGLSLAYCGLEDCQRSRQCVEPLLRIGQARRNTLLLVTSLAAQAVILAHENAKERAIELLGLADTYADDIAGWMQHWPLLNRLRAELQRELGQENYQSVWERGKTLDLDTVVA